MDQLASPLDVLLVSMPFGQARLPSIGLSLLRQGLLQRGMNARIAYETLEYAKLLGEEAYSALSAGSPVNHDLAGEWVFSGELFGERKSDDSYYDEILRGRNQFHKKKDPALAERAVQSVAKARKLAPEFLDEACARILSLSPRVVGFTSVFQQHVASLALAKRLKARCPEITIVLGGANCEGAMGLATLAEFPFVDYVVSGEGDLVFPALVEYVLRRRSEYPSFGVMSQSRVFEYQSDRVPNPASVSVLDELPMPDYADFLAQWTASGLGSGGAKPRLLFESARGCWWGEKSHCTFCGLNGGTMKFRSKSPERVIDEIQTIANQCAGADISVVDNIMDYRYFKTVLPRLAEMKLELNLFYELKANLTREQLLTLASAGIKTIQPGIESLIGNVLKLMRKGIRPMQNLQVLKWCEELQICPEWNVLWGFPGENPEDYYKLAPRISRLTHLTPPGAAASIRLDRFSPNFNEAMRVGFRNVKPYPAYEYVYPGCSRIRDMAYYFCYEYGAEQCVEDYTRDIGQEIKLWQNRPEDVGLYGWKCGEDIIIADTRPCAQTSLYKLRGHLAAIVLQCDCARNADILRVALSINADTLRQAIDRLDQLGLIWLDHEELVSLVPFDDGEVENIRAARTLNRAITEAKHVGPSNIAPESPFKIDSIPAYG